MSDPSIRRQRERERREWIARAEEQQRHAAEQLERDRKRSDELKNQLAQINTVRANALLAGYQHARYCEKVQNLFALDRLINGN